MKIRRILAVWTAKAACGICRHMGRQGVTWAGKLALMIYPPVLRELAAEVRGKIFIVCGTNGKTTTNNLLCSALEAEGQKIVCNRTGSNMLNGVAAAFVLAAGMDGRIDADHACIEVDEASTRHIFPQFHPDYMVLTNLFRDQLDRYGEIDITMDILKGVLDSSPRTELIINGDDALSAFLALECRNPSVTYGISEQVAETSDTDEIREGRFCKKCGARLSYRFYHYSQLGDYSCPQCGFSRPPIDHDARGVRVGDQLSFSVGSERIVANYRGFYNVYNILAAYAAGRHAGFPLTHFNQMLKDFHPENGRMESFRICNTAIVLNLAKNPAGFNQNIAAVMTDPRPKDLIIVINDNEQDGTDVSWLWDVDFDRFSGDRINSITVSGIRCRDMQLRLKYADIPSILDDDVESAIWGRVIDGCGNLYMLVNYTALFSTRNILKKLEDTRS